MDSATVTIICGTVVALQSAWITFRLRQQDDARNAARGELVKTAQRLKDEATVAADEVAATVEKRAVEVAQTVEQRATETDIKLDEIHVLVNTRLTEALLRIQSLETSLGVAPGADVPARRTAIKRAK